MTQYKLRRQEVLALRAVESSPLTSIELFNAVHPKDTYATVATFVTDTLAVLVEKDVMLFQDGKWSHGPAAFAYLSTLEGLEKAEQFKRKLTVATGRYSPPAEHYSGAELQTTCLRKGAYDYLGMPSRIGNEFVNHRTAHLAVI